MKPTAQQLAHLIVTLLNLLWTKAKARVQAADENIRNWAETTFVKKSTLTSDVQAIGDVRYHKQGDAIDAATVNGQTATQIINAAHTDALLIAEQTRQALRSRAVDFALVPFLDNVDLNFASVVAARLGDLSTLVDGPYELRFNGEAKHKATMYSYPNTDNNSLVIDGSDSIAVSNGDIILFTVASGAITKIEFFNDNTNHVLVNQAADISDINVRLNGIDSDISNLSNTVTTNGQTLAALVQAAITTDDFAGMKAYIEANIEF